MYLSNYPEGSAALCQDLIHASPLGLLISGSGPNWSTSLLPFVLQENNGQLTLVTHLARANPQWQCLEGQSVLVNFVGANAYVSPTILNLHVPTWNYATVQIRGIATVPTERDDCESLLRDLTDHFEKRNGTMWKLNLPEVPLGKMLAAIVGVEIAVTEINGKFKLSQNRTREEHQIIENHLRESPRSEDNGVAYWMRKVGWT
jgi:transcriptional regulator